MAEVSSIWIAQNVERKLRNFLGHKFWARGYFVSTVGRDKGTIRTYIKNQEIADKAVESVATEAVPSLVPESFITAFGGSPSNPQLCWGLLARRGLLQDRCAVPLHGGGLAEMGGPPPGRRPDRDWTKT